MLLPPLSIGDAGRGSARVVGSRRPSVLRPVRGSGNQALPDDTTTDGARMPTWAPADACGHVHARRACAYETYVGGYAATHDHAVHPLLVDGYASLFIHTRRRGRGSTCSPPYVDTPPRRDGGLHIKNATRRTVVLGRRATGDMPRAMPIKDQEWTCQCHTCLQ